MADQPKKILIYDTTLRDGEQSPGFTMTMDEKERFACQLNRLGVDVIEAGFPASNREDFEAVKKISQVVRGTQVSALARAMEQDIDRAWEAVKSADDPRIHIFVPSSDIQMKYQLRKTGDEIINLAVEAVKKAKGYMGNVQFTAMDATRSDKDFLVILFSHVIKAGASVINVADTVGISEPFEFYDLIKYLKEKVIDIDMVILSVHCHNDLGLATANSIAAIRAGALQVEGTINGIGERAGNASLEEIIMAIHVKRENLKAVTGANTKEIMATSDLLTKITGSNVQPNKAIVGSNAFAHESGIHQDGILKKTSTYEILSPELIGREKTNIVIGKHSGRHGLRKRLEELGYKMDEAELNRLFHKFKKFTYKKKSVNDDELIEFIERVS